MKRLLDEERARERFLELHIEDEQSEEHMDAVEAYLEYFPKDDDLEGFESWVENDWAFGFNKWYEEAERDAAYERVESRLD
jgi:hypothetical protein